MSDKTTNTKAKNILATLTQNTIQDQTTAAKNLLDHYYGQALEYAPHDVRGTTLSAIESLVQKMRADFDSPFT